AVDDPLQVLDRAQMRLVVRIGLRFARAGGRGQPGQPGRDAARRKVLRNAVIFVPPAVLARLRDVQVADRPHPRLQVIIHAWKIADEVCSWADLAEGRSSVMAGIPEFTTRPELAGTFGMVASTHWLASAAGLAVLESGGNAFDAAAAAGFVLQVVEPHLNGPGGEVPVIGFD